MAKKSLNLEDAALWKKVTDTVTPIDRQDWIIEYETEVSVTSSSPVKPAITPQVNKNSAPPPVVPPKKKQMPSLIPADLDQKGFGGISRSAARSMKTGQSGYTKRIDLHGSTLADAHTKLKSFILGAAAEGHRHVLVITGKGTQNKGVIRSNLPLWLNEPPLSAHVIAYCQAQIKDGGAGAWYVNLRRRG